MSKEKTNDNSKNFYAKRLAEAAQEACSDWILGIAPTEQ
jgi:hypothetical protein